LKILVINYEYPPVGGGAGEVSKRLAEQFAALGHEILVATSAWGDLPKEQDESGVHVVRHFAGRRSKDRSSVLGMAAYLAFGAIPVLRQIRRFRPDILHAHFAVPCGPLAYLAGRLMGVPYVITFHGGDVPSAARHMSKAAVAVHKTISPILKLVLQRAACNVAVGQGLRELMRSDFPYLRDIECIPNGVSTDLFQPRRRAQEDDILPVRLIYAGRFREVKDLDTLVDALSLLSQDSELPNWDALLLGDGPDWKRIQARIDELGLRDRVQLPGWFDHEKLAAELRNADIAILSSKSEGMPVSVLQAMAAGLPVVGTNVVGVNEVVVDGEYGRLAPAGDSAALAAAMSELIADKNKRVQFGQAAQARVEKDYAWRPIANRYLELFQKILKDLRQ